MQPPTRNDVILIGSSARAAAASARAAGLRITAVDDFGDADLRRMCCLYHPRLPTGAALRFLLAHPPSTIVPLGGCERSPEQLTTLSRRHRLAGATQQQWHQASDPAVMRKLAEAAGARFPESHRLTERTLSLPNSGQRWLLKKRQRCGGLDVRWFDPRQAPLGAGRNEEAYLQRWIEGTAIGASYLASRRRVTMLGVCRGLSRETNSHPALFAGVCGPIAMPPQPLQVLQRLGEAASEQLQIRGLFNIDLIWLPNEGLYLLEVNPRYTAAMELLEPTPLAPLRHSVDTPTSRSEGGSLLAAHLDAFSAARPPVVETATAPQPPADEVRTVRCKRVIFAERELRFDAAVRKRIEAQLRDRSAGYADVPVDGTVIAAEHPVLTLFTEASSADGAIARAESVVADLERMC